MNIYKELSHIFQNLHIAVVIEETGSKPEVPGLDMHFKGQTYHPCTYILCAWIFSIVHPPNTRFARSPIIIEVTDLNFKCGQLLSISCKGLVSAT